MKKITILLCLFSIFFANAQNITKADMDKEIRPLTEKIKQLNSENVKIKRDFDRLNAKMDSLKTQAESKITNTSQELGSKISATEKKSSQKIEEVNQSLSDNSLYGIIGVLAAVLVSILLYWLLSKQQKTDKTDFEGQISKTQKSIEEEQIQVNTKLAELYNGQMELIRTERKAVPNSQTIDHSLPLKVADEIVKIQMNLIHMDSKIRGHKQLSIAVTNVFDNFKANGYEIVDHLNKPYDDGMNMQATMEPDPNLKEGEQIIRRIIKPEIQFNNKVIQNAQVIVAYGE